MPDAKNDVWRNYGSDPFAPILHASAVCIQERGLLILGQSGSGKSELALQMMAFGADLVADDRVIVRRRNSALVLAGHPTLNNMIEARGIGLLAATTASNAKCHYIVDLSAASQSRLHDLEIKTFLNCNVPYLKGAGVPNLAPALVQLLKSGFSHSD